MPLPLHLFKVSLACSFDIMVLAHDQQEAHEIGVSQAEEAYNDLGWPADYWEVAGNEAITRPDQVYLDDQRTIPYRVQSDIMDREVAETFGRPEPTVAEILAHWVKMADQQDEIDAAQRRQTNLPFTAGHPGEDPNHA